MMMGDVWESFLAAQHALLDEDETAENATHLMPPALCAIRHLAVLSIAGRDAATFLQGQITCNINDICDSQSCFGAICTPKGRAIAVFILVRQAGQIMLVLPATQLQAVKNHLHKYILRAAVSLTDSSDSLCLLGKWPSNPVVSPPLLTHQIGSAISIALPSRELIIAPQEQAINLWLALTREGYRTESPAMWRYDDITTGVPWLCQASAEHYIPQMLNLDHMGGISFDKGCYTGQEIIARTHYLGKTKRGLFAGKCDVQQAPETHTDILDGQTKEVIGHVLAAQCLHQTCHLLMVLQKSESNTYQATLADDTPITLAAINYD